MCKKSILSAKTSNWQICDECDINSIDPWHCLLEHEIYANVMSSVKWYMSYLAKWLVQSYANNPILDLALIPQHRMTQTPFSPD